MPLLSGHEPAQDLPSAPHPTGASLALLQNNQSLWISPPAPAISNPGMEIFPPTCTGTDVFRAHSLSHQVVLV